ncbi:HIT domain-containing protein [Streptomyces gardneri]|nr:HIT domain-containing protein [Streptomyces gardneri]
MTYAAELAARHPAANVIASRRGLDSDFGPIHVVPRTRDDGLKLPWTEQQEGKIHDKLLPEDPCIFDKILDGKIPAEVTKRWDNGMAFVPLDPVIPGKHQLVIATEHTRDIGADFGREGTPGPEIAAATMTNFVDLTRDMPHVDMVTSRGVEATQSVPHTHLHALEREEGDGLELMTNP